MDTTPNTRYEKNSIMLHCKKKTLGRYLPADNVGYLSWQKTVELSEETRLN